LAKEETEERVRRKEDKSECRYTGAIPLLLGQVLFFCTSFGYSLGRGSSCVLQSPPSGGLRLSLVMCSPLVLGHSFSFFRGNAITCFPGSSMDSSDVLREEDSAVQIAFRREPEALAFLQRASIRTLKIVERSQRSSKGLLTSLGTTLRDLSRR
jgi:hypothetical protein